MRPSPACGTRCSRSPGRPDRPPGTTRRTAASTCSNRQRGTCALNIVLSFHCDTVAQTLAGFLSVLTPAQHASSRSRTPARPPPGTASPGLGAGTPSVEPDRVPGGAVRMIVRIVRTARVVEGPVRGRRDHRGRLRAGPLLRRRLAHRRRQFSNVNGLTGGNEVRIGGIEVGTVQSLEVNADPQTGQQSAQVALHRRQRALAAAPGDDRRGAAQGCAQQRVRRRRAGLARRPVARGQPDLRRQPHQQPGQPRRALQRLRPQRAHLDPHPAAGGRASSSAAPGSATSTRPSPTSTR